MTVSNCDSRGGLPYIADCLDGRAKKALSLERIRDTCWGTISMSDSRPTHLMKTHPTIDDVRAIAKDLPRSYEALVRDRVKFRVGRIVWIAFSRDETVMGFAFPKEEREAMIESEPTKFVLPKPSDLRYNWLVVRLTEIDHGELLEIVHDAWRMVVPKKVAAEYFRTD
jgi:hypothetical protein